MRQFKAVIPLPDRGRHCPQPPPAACKAWKNYTPLPSSDVSIGGTSSLQDRLDSALNRLDACLAAIETKQNMLWILVSRFFSSFLPAIKTWTIPPALPAGFKTAFKTGCAFSICSIIWLWERNLQGNAKYYCFSFSHEHCRQAQLSVCNLSIIHKPEIIKTLLSYFEKCR